MMLTSRRPARDSLVLNPLTMPRERSQLLRTPRMQARRRNAEGLHMQHGAAPRLTTAASWSGVGVGVGMGVGGGLPSQSDRCETAGTACAPGRTQRGEPRWDFTTHVPEIYVSPFLGKDPADQALRSERARLQHQIFGAVSSSATDSNGRPRGVGAGVPNSRDAGTLKKDFVLARYGEYAVMQTATASASAPKSARNNVCSPHVGAVGSTDPVPPGAPHAPSDSPQRGATREDLQGGLTFHEARAAAQYWTAAEWLSQRAASAVARGEASTENQPADPHLTVSPRAQPNSAPRTPVQPRVGPGIPYAAQGEPSTPRTPRTEMLTPRISTAVHAPSGTGRIAMSPFPASRPGTSQTNRSGTAPSQGGQRDPESRKAPEDPISPAPLHGPHHFRPTTYLHKKPLSNWKGLKTPGFYLTSLPEGSTGSVPSKFFQKAPSMMVSTDGHQLKSAFVNKPLPNDAQHLSASKEYFAPKGLGTFRCSICDRSFLNQKLLEQHCNRQVVRVRLKSLLANDFVVLTVCEHCVRFCFLKYVSTDPSKREQHVPCLQ